MRTVYKMLGEYIFLSNVNPIGKKILEKILISLITDGVLGVLTELGYLFKYHYY